jgi:hypothetical protein
MQKTLAAILHLGNIEFAKDPNSDQAFLPNNSGMLMEHSQRNYVSQIIDAVFLRVVAIQLERHTPFNSVGLWKYFSL